MSRRLEFFFDYVSPYSYLASSQLPALGERTGAELVYRPFFLGGVMNETGNRPPATVPSKGAYMLTDLARWAARYGLPFQMNPHFPTNTLLALRGALVLLAGEGFVPYHQAMFRAMWSEGANVGDPAVLGAIVAKLGLDPSAFLARASEPAQKEALKANTAEAVARGAFGAPTFFVGEQMFFGNDRFAFIEEALR